MIKTITVTNHLNQSLVLELGFPDKSGLLIQEIKGLGPGKATINMTELSTSDGASYNSGRVAARNIVMKLIFLEKPTIEDTRQRTYTYFPIKQMIRLLIETDSRLAEIYGYVESNEPVIFSKQETTQISIVCPDPYFYSAGKQGKTTTVFSGVENLFEFPFANESLSENLIEFGKLHMYEKQTIYYTGDAEVGIDIKIHALGTVENLTIFNASTDEIMKLDTDRLIQLTGEPIVSGDDIFISTLKGQKSIYLLRGGVYTNILSCLGRDTDWFQLRRGDNIFSFTADEGASNLQFQIINQTAVYEGV